MKSQRIFLTVTLALILCAWLARPVRADTLLSTDFETDPTTQGWTTIGGSLATWTTNESFSGIHSLSATNGGTWLSPLLPTSPLQWYRLSFKSKAPGVLHTPGAAGYAYWAASYFDTNGNPLIPDQYSSIFSSADWVTNEFRIRAKCLAGTNGTLLPEQMAIRFQAINPQVYIDDVLVETTTPEEVAQWGDALYDTLPAKLAYMPKVDRWSHLPLTLNRLRTGQNLRVVMMGDSVESDTQNSPFDAWLERLYPGANIQLIDSIIGGGSIEYFATNMASEVFAYQPDLLCIGGISNDDNLTAFQKVVNQMRTNDLATGRNTEILILTKQWSPNSTTGDYLLNPGYTELDQVPASNPGGVPSGYRGDLLNFCATNNIEYLDLTGVASEFIYGPAASGGVGPPVNTNGDPYSYWMRDQTHSNDRGKLIQGRMIEAFFAPPPFLNAIQTAGSLILAWPLASTGYTLETTTTLGPEAAWNTVPTEFTITNGQNVVTTNLDNETQFFFRLSRP